MNKLIHILICCALFSLTWACDDDEDTPVSGKDIEVAFGSKEFRIIENITPLQIAVVLSTPAQHDITVNGYVKSENNAKEGIDYTFITKKIVIPAGKSSGYFEVEIKDYPVYRPDRSFIFEITQVEGARLSTTDACQVIISSNEGLPVIGFSQSLLSVAEECQKTDISVALNHTWDKDINFRIRPLVNKSTAIFDEHYKLDTLSTYTISAGDTAILIPVTIIDDIIENDNRYFELEVYGNTESTLSEVYRTMKITIIDDEEPVYVCFERTAVKGAESGGPIWVPIRVKGNPKTPVKVTLEPRDGKAIEGKDYRFEERSLTFQVGNKLDSVRVYPIDNNDYDLDRSFTIGFASVTGAQLATSDTLITVTIANDDFDPTQLYDDLMGEWTLSKAEGGNVPTKVTVTISGGDTPQEEDANYLKYLIVKCEKFGENSYPARWRLSYNPEDGSLAVILGEVITENVPFNAPRDIKFDRGSATNINPVKIIPSTDYKTLTWDPNVIVYGGGYDRATGVRDVLWLILDKVVMTRND